MSETVKHTPGPWVWRGKSGSLHQVGEAPYAYGKVVLSPEWEYDTGVDTHINDADARLIAAAPELLEALAKIEALGSDGEHSGDRHARCRDIARAAIAKSEPTP